LKAHPKQIFEERPSILKNLTAILTGVRPGVDFSASTDFVKDGFLDSLDVIRLVGELDEAYSISIPGEDIVSDNFVNLQSIERLVEKHRRSG
jgi:acyl carrier protein